MQACSSSFTPDMEGLSRYSSAPSINPNVSEDSSLRNPFRKKRHSSSVSVPSKLSTATLPPAPSPLSRQPRQGAPNLYASGIDAHSGDTAPRPSEPPMPIVEPRGKVVFSQWDSTEGCRSVWSSEATDARTARRIDHVVDSASRRRRRSSAKLVEPTANTGGRASLPRRRRASSEDQPGGNSRSASLPAQRAEETPPPSAVEKRWSSVQLLQDILDRDPRPPSPSPTSSSSRISQWVAQTRAATTTPTPTMRQKKDSGKRSIPGIEPWTEDGNPYIYTDNQLTPVSNSSSWFSRVFYLLKPDHYDAT